MGTKIFCKNCGKLNDKASGFCMECGKPLTRSTMMEGSPSTDVLCPICGAKTESARRFCNACGADRVPTATEAVPESEDTVRLCSQCGIINNRFTTCYGCGSNLLAPPSSASADTDGRSASGRQRTCSVCLGFFPIEDILDFNGRHYCPECIIKVEL